MQMVTETWRPVVGREDEFEVSSMGNVRSLPHTIRHWSGSAIARSGTILKQSRHSAGYLVVSLRDGRKHYVHRLVMDSFNYRSDANSLDVNHKNGNKHDNRLENLEWASRLQNVRHAIATGLQNNAGENNGRSKYSERQIVQVKRLLRDGESIASAAKKTEVSRDTVEAVARGDRWAHVDASVTAPDDWSKPAE
jgi:hypothetical protein